jgi:rhodanese-related sulfurtransferase
MTSEQIFIYALVGIIILFYVRKQLAQRGISHYAPADAKQQVKQGSVLLDVRTAPERKSSSISGSIHIPLQELGSRIKDLERYRSKEIICYCASGSRSVNAAAKLKKAGFTVGNLKGGMAAWNFSNL